MARLQRLFAACPIAAWLAVFWLAIFCLAVSGPALGEPTPGEKPAGGELPGGQARLPQVVVPVRTIPAGAVIAAGDVALQAARQPPTADTVRAPADAVGQEARRALYAKQPIRKRDIGPVTLVERNARVTLRFRQGALELTTAGRALEAGGLGQIIRIMNLDSRRTVYGRISGAGTVDAGS